ncbi:nuclear transport factor 2 family protein [Flagellimonas lutimaris]|uniref:Nuclear transport factor 2 family protein n=1 Tax=Flagellimonas lutimaris TaxID=475082 RepID=A0A3A1N839_9FLAO|nr:nuclear transport factor 2 family protein [Allomuricauda lutimaris]RIV32870.1 nuclear transport factor 2 family protein [Allomuricauda lutimaris]
MKFTIHLLFIVLSFLLHTPEIYSQTNKEEILAIRNASNQALKAYDNTQVLSYLTNDVLTTTGKGTLLSSKKALKQYILEGGESKMYWVRTAKEIMVNEKRGLAWENGVWKGYNPEKGNNAIVGGNYSAMWTKASGKWKIKSQLFVTLEEK